VITVIDDEKYITTAELRGVVALARRNPECEFNQKVKTMYDEMLAVIIKRATAGYTDYTFTEGNCQWCGYPSCTEPLRHAARKLAADHKFNISWAWNKKEQYVCKSIHIDWENDGDGSIKSSTY
jgi:hypothetical protein